MMLEFIAELGLNIIRFFVKDIARRQEYERAILDTLSRWNNRPPRSKRVRDAWNDIVGKIDEDSRNGVQVKEETETEA